MAVGALLIDRKATKLRLECRTESVEFATAALSTLADALLQAARIKFTKTEYISCPGCGRTLYNLQETIARIKAATSHLVGLKIGIMGCIVNGPGEMADADYGYVGAGRGKISLYRKKECIEKNIPEEEAVDRLLAFIEEDLKRIES
jgi:(E)-4-hydroxy-3-methylbut-2-enyl-diphosphate synthase